MITRSLLLQAILQPMIIFVLSKFFSFTTQVFLGALYFSLLLSVIFAAAKEFYDRRRARAGGSA